MGQHAADAKHRRIMELDSNMLQQNLKTRKWKLYGLELCGHISMYYYYYLLSLVHYLQNDNKIIHCQCVGALGTLPQVLQNSGLGDVDDERPRSACIRRTSWKRAGAGEALTVDRTR